jgi:hypothetical protein
MGDGRRLVVGDGAGYDGVVFEAAVHRLAKGLRPASRPRRTSAGAEGGEPPRGSGSDRGRGRSGSGHRLAPTGSARRRRLRRPQRWAVHARQVGVRTVIRVSVTAGTAASRAACVCGQAGQEGAGRVARSRGRSSRVGGAFLVLSSRGVQGEEVDGGLLSAPATGARGVRGRRLRPGVPAGAPPPSLVLPTRCGDRARAARYYRATTRPTCAVPDGGNDHPRRPGRGAGGSGPGADATPGPRTTYSRKPHISACSGRSNAQYLWIPHDGRGRTFPMDRSMGHRARPTLLRRSGRHARAYGSQRGRQPAKRQLAA